MKRFRFLTEGLAGDVFYDPDSPPQGSVLLLPGFPSFIGANPLVQQFVAAGFVLLSPHYYGTYDSVGSISPATMTRTAKDSEQAVLEGRIVSMRGTPTVDVPAITVAVGHSFGAAVLARSAQALASVELLLFLAPAIHFGRAPVDYGVRFDAYAMYYGAIRSHPLTYRVAPLEEWSDILDGTAAPTMTNLAQRVRSAHCVIGDRDASFDTEVAAMVTPSLVQSFIGPVPTTMQVLPSTGHYVDELLKVDSGFSIPAWLARTRVGACGHD